jgi:hypothetical protein
METEVVDLQQMKIATMLVSVVERHAVSCRTHYMREMSLVAKNLARSSEAIRKKLLM